MRLSFFDPTREEVVAVATDLITRFGLEAQDEALHLTGVAANIRAVRNCQLYRLAAREIEKSFAEARTRMSTAPASKQRDPVSLARRDLDEASIGALLCTHEPYTAHTARGAEQEK